MRPGQASRGRASRAAALTPPEEEFEGDALVALLTRAGGPAVAAALIGCRVYRDDPDGADLVLACDTATGRVVARRPGGQEREVALRGAYVLSDDGRLRAATEAATTDADRALAGDLRLVATFGLTGRMEAADAALLAAAIRTIAREELSGEADRRRAVALARKYGTPRTLLRFTDQWRRLAGSATLPDVTVAHVKALRDLGDVVNALAATAVVTGRDHGLPRATEAVLLTQRAALWLDLAELRGEPELLGRAHSAAGRAYRLAPSEELGAVYGRLRKLEAGNDAARDEAAGRRARQRLRDAGRSASPPVRPGTLPDRSGR